jgi:hypothetical protein
MSTFNHPHTNFVHDLALDPHSKGSESDLHSDDVPTSENDSTPLPRWEGMKKVSTYHIWRHWTNIYK